MGDPPVLGLETLLTDVVIRPGSLGRRRGPLQPRHIQRRVFLSGICGFGVSVFSS